MLQWKSISNITEICNIGGDQNYFTQYYFEHLHLSHHIRLDIRQKVFQSMLGLDYSHDFMIINGYLYNKIMKTFTCITHFHGFKDMEPKNVLNIKTNMLENALTVFVNIMEKSIKNKYKTNKLIHRYPFDIYTQKCK